MDASTRYVTLFSPSGPVPGMAVRLNQQDPFELADTSFENGRHGAHGIIARVPYAIAGRKLVADVCSIGSLRLTDAEWIAATGAPLVSPVALTVGNYTTGHADALHVVCNDGPTHRSNGLVVESTWISSDALWLAIVFSDGTDVVFMTSDASPIYAYEAKDFRGRVEAAAGFPTDSTLFRVSGITDTGERTEFRSYWFWCGESEPGLGKLWIACTSNPVLAPHLRMESFRGWIEIDPTTPKTYTAPHREPVDLEPKGPIEP